MDLSGGVGVRDRRLAGGRVDCDAAELPDISLGLQRGQRPFAIGFLRRQQQIGGVLLVVGDEGMALKVERERGVDAGGLALSTVATAQLEPLVLVACANLRSELALS